MQPIDIEQVKRVSGKLGRQNPPQVPLTSPALATFRRKNGGDGPCERIARAGKAAGSDGFGEWRRRGEQEAS